MCTLSVFAYFAASLLGAQFLIPPPDKMDNTTFPYSKVSFSTQEPFIIHTPDLYFPIFTVLEFIGECTVHTAQVDFFLVQGPTLDKKFCALDSFRSAGQKFFKPNV